MVKHLTVCTKKPNILLAANMTWSQKFNGKSCVHAFQTLTAKLATIVNCGMTPTDLQNTIIYLVENMKGIVILSNQRE